MKTFETNGKVSENLDETLDVTSLIDVTKEEIEESKPAFFWESNDGHTLHGGIEFNDIKPKGREKEDLSNADPHDYQLDFTSIDKKAGLLIIKAIEKSKEIYKEEFMKNFSDKELGAIVDNLDIDLNKKEATITCWSTGSPEGLRFSKKVKISFE